MNNCSGRASYNTAYEPTPMRTPMSKMKESVLSAEAPEFVPSFHKPATASVVMPEMASNIGPPIIQQHPPPSQQHHHPLSTQQQQSQGPFPSHLNHHPAHHHSQQINHNQHLQQNHHQPQPHHPHHHNHHHQQHHHQHQHQPHHHHNMSQNQLNQKMNMASNGYSVNNRLQFNGVAGGNIRQGQQQQSHYNQQQQPSQQQLQMRGGGGIVSNNQQNQQQQQQNEQQLQQLQLNSRYDGNDADNNEPTEAEIQALSFLIEVMNKLMTDPGQFENVQKEITTLFLEFSENQHVMSNAIELIFNQSIDEQNFRYTGARLCRLLDSLNPSPDSVFRRLLCYKLQYNDSEILQYLTNETHKVRNTTLFLAELYIQLQNDGTRITSIASSIHNAISLLMPKMSPENIKCVCQTLKLCGYELDIDFPKETENLMGQLSSLENIDVSTQRLLSSVIELRKNRWGRSEPNALSTPIPQPIDDSKAFNNDPVFYGPDGKILTDEESAFLWNVTSYPNDGYDDDEENDPDALVDCEPEMDLEIQLAFKDFVTYQHNK